MRFQFAILAILFLLIFCIIWIKHIYIQYQEDKKFFKEVDRMIDHKNKIFLDALEKSFKQIDSFLIKNIKN